MERKRKSDLMRNTKSVKSSRVVEAMFRNQLEQSVDVINAAWVTDKTLHTDSDVHLNVVPFKHCIVKNIINDPEFLRELKGELLELKFITKRNDLYQFHQSCDLASVDTPMVNKLKQFLNEDCCTWLKKATGINLDGKVSVTCSSYNYSDHLLCHDDKCEDRRIAFILYLNEEWLPDFGGSLELFNTDDNGQPKEVVEKIWPTFNSLVFFEVMNKSFHQVAEVKVLDRARLSVNGWFHGPLPVPEKRAENPHVDIQMFSPIQDESDILKYVKPMYLDPEMHEQISSNFEESSEILLPDFLSADFYNEICQCLCDDDISWQLKGPANHRKYETLSDSMLPSPLNKLVQLFKSEQFFKLLGNITKLDLAPLPKDKAESSILMSQPKCTYEIQRWQSGFYTLMRDEHFGNEYALDVILYCNVHSMKQLHGGFVSYIARDADEELLTLLPSCNALALAFRDKETIHFVKYINSVFSGCFNMIHFVYYETCTSSNQEA